MALFVSIVLGSLVFLLVAQGILVAGFVVALWRLPRRPLLADEACPPAAVILCLRGMDPFLPRCLAAIAQQDYPRFEVRVVVDRQGDPAWSAVERAIADHPSCAMTVTPLEARQETCSLKCSSLVQAATDIGDRVQFLAQLDADTIPHRSWLRELATALADEHIGAATGNRWYMPEDADWGSLVRYLWNAAAVVQMYWYRIAWGGTLAVKTSVIREAKLLERWSHALCEDTMLYTQLRPVGQRIAFVPSLMMINRESCDLPGFAAWVSRQLLTARLYHPGWPAVVAHGVGITLGLAAAVILLGAALLLGDLKTAALLGAGIVGYEVATALLLAPMEVAVRRLAKRRGEPVAWLSGVKGVRLLVALVVTQVVYPVTLATACLARRIAWRAAQYRIGGPWKIRLIADPPFAEAATSLENSSLPADPRLRENRSL